MKSLPGRGGPLRLRPVTAADLRRHDLGRSTRQVSTALRELLGVLDGERCRFPGCPQRKKLHAHHVELTCPLSPLLLMITEPDGPGQVRPDPAAAG